MQKARILIIDASAETRSMYADYFRYHGYRVAVAADGAEGVRVSAALRPDLVVTELSGDREWIEALRTLRRPGSGRTTPVITCSTMIDRHWPFAPAWMDVDVALPKPISPRALLLEAQQLLARPAA
jgi:DNA-binding response OmpR family regulator